MPDLVVDAHVHLNASHDIGAVLEATCSRMMAQGNTGCIPVILLAEQSGISVFETIRAGSTPTKEAESVWVATGAGRMLVVAGRQIVSAERLEILALATSRAMPDGLPAVSAVHALVGDDAVVVLPWGVGKWVGARGLLVEQLLAAESGRHLFLGDNGGRPWFWPVRKFRGRRVLPGSDPLPVRDGPDRIGGFGFRMHADISEDWPATDLRRALRNRPWDLQRFGHLASVSRFARDQFGLRVQG